MKRILLIITTILIIVAVFLTIGSWLTPRPDIATKEQKKKAEKMCKFYHHKTPPQEFTSDGCSLWPDSGIRSCCLEHDMEYWCGGSLKERQEADRAFMQCIARKQNTGNGLVEYIGVRGGGSPFLPLSWRWGYGWDWPKYKNKLRNN